MEIVRKSIIIKIMRTFGFIFAVFLFLVSCEVQTEKSQDSSMASKGFITKYLKGDYASIYEDGSIEMKSYVTKDIFLNITRTQEKVYGKMKESELQGESMGNYKTSTTKVYNYQLKNEKDEMHSLTAEFLDGHLLKNHIEAQKWASESAFTESLVNPIADLVSERNYDRIYELLGEKYPLDQIESLIQKIAKECDGVPNRYESCWIDNDANGKMIVAFEYAYEGKGYLDYRFYIEADEYPFAGIFFQPDSETKLP